jgi:histidinol-phosphate/aromatic aminotransferase/cobyric acid decarboxylase-like protein/GNAT superfamily N-acetyltransferase
MIRAATTRTYDVRLADPADRRAIYALRHAVYAAELGQHPRNAAGALEDGLDAHNEYIVATCAGRIVGFISITPPGEHGYSIDRYVKRGDLPFACDGGLYELRLLTVAADHRGSPVASLLMYAGFRWISSLGATQVVALGRTGATVGLYEKGGFRRLPLRVRAGNVGYEVMHAPVDSLRAAVREKAAHTRRLGRACRWSLPLPFHEPAGCFHGGASISALGETFDALDRTARIITADVLDAWFPPAPAVLEALREHLSHLVRSSPPTDCGGLLRTIEECRGVPAAMLVPGAGSSDLIFRAFRAWLSPGSRVLMLDPTYGEYAHVAEQVIGCRVDRIALHRERGYRPDSAELLARCGDGYDLVVLVNPNSPTGQVLTAAEVRSLAAALPPETRLWVDETYIDYCGPASSVEADVERYPRLFVCKSMSKVYALSGARVAYLCAPPGEARALRAITPPWIVSAPAQIAAIRALREGAYYRRMHRETLRLGRTLAAGLRAVDGIEEVTEGVANFFIGHLDPEVADAITFCERARERGLYLRDLRGMSTRSHPHAFRIAVKDRETNRRMLAIVRAVLAGDRGEANVGHARAAAS